MHHAVLYIHKLLLDGIVYISGNVVGFFQRFLPVSLNDYIKIYTVLVNTLINLR